MRYSEMTEQQLVRHALHYGRVRTKGAFEPSELLPSFEDALARASKDDLLWALDYLIHTKRKRQSWRKVRIQKIDRKLRELLGSPP